MIWSPFTMKLLKCGVVGCVSSQMDSQGSSLANVCVVGCVLAMIRFRTFTAMGLNRVGSTWLYCPAEFWMICRVGLEVVAVYGSKTGMSNPLASVKLEKSPCSHCGLGSSKVWKVGIFSLYRSQLNMKKVLFRPS